MEIRIRTRKWILFGFVFAFRLLLSSGAEGQRVL